MLTITHLDQLKRLLGSERDATLDDCFALRWLETEYDLPRERAIHQVAIGHSIPLGINAFHVDEPKQTLFIFICKASKHVNSFGDPLQLALSNGIPSLFAESTEASIDALQAILTARPAPGPSRFLRHFSSVLSEYRAVIEHVCVRLVFYGAVDGASDSALFRSFVEDAAGHCGLIAKALARSSVDVRCDIVSADGSRSRPDPLAAFTRSIAMSNTVSQTTPDGQVMHVGLLRLMDLLDIYSRLHLRFLARNVRAALDSDTGSNRALRRAFSDVARGDAPPEAFLFRHNGVTLTAKTCRPHEGSLELEEPQLLNGAQTVTTLARLVEDWRTSGDFSSAMATRLKRLLVICRVITNADKDFISSVTIASNRQNPIMPWHLRAHDPIQEQLQAWFLDHLGLYYEIQEGAFDNMTGDEMEWYGILQDRCLGIKKLGQTFLATEGMVDKMQNVKVLFEDDSIYQQAFCAGRLKASPQDVVFCFKVDRRIGKMLNLLGGSEKYAFAKSARSLIWALLCQAFLNAKNREQLSSNHGNGLTATKDFTDAVERLALSHVRPLLMWIANESQYVDAVKSEKYAFLTSKKIFAECLAVARERWGWQHRRLGTCP